ncbi:unnamed protein product [Candida verbasci]|uniref:UBA domain-containing protein n=1 Tax=Candida verbasci TaxID=1227364 RepID=A0A9W4TSC9_9ASCO|nr:unnamed protein product [Candida verbasci]
MAPKKDAFADLFSSATGNTSKINNLSLLERQKLQKQGNNQQQQHPYQSNSNSSSLNSSWSNLDILSQEPSSRPSRVSSPFINRETSPVVRSNTEPNNEPKNDDPFPIFENASKVEPKTSTTSNNGTKVAPDDIFSEYDSDSKINESFANKNEILLLDDEFTDVFPEFKPAAHSKPQQRPKPPVPERKQAFKKESEEKDFIVAELIDMGFSIDLANEAINNQGLDLQNCVNYIMSKNSKSSNRQSRQDNYEDSVLGSRPEGINFNELSNNLYKQANNIFNIGKQHVIRNLEKFKDQDKNGNMPEWMRNQSKYKSQAIEKRLGSEDYGSDEENINHEEIERYMKLQMEKNAERRNKLNQRNEISRSSNESSKSRVEPEVTIRPRPNRFKQKELKQESPQFKPETKESTQPSKLKQESPQPSQPISTNQPEEDILGMFTNSTTSKSVPSALRDSTPLNQFIETDYTTLKKQAQESYKSGDYTTALESYTSCLVLLPRDHELRVVILSNLALINKLSGHLKQSVNNIDEALSLIDDSEIFSDFEISSKSIKYWYVKLISIKAETLELLEKYESSLENYILLITKLNCNDTKIMDGKRRVDKIVNPQNYKPVKTSTPKSKAQPTPISKPKPKQVEKVEEVDTMTKDKIDMKVKSWADSKQNNLRQMLSNLQEIIPPKIKINEKLKTLTLNDLMLPKQIKINYMKIISSIHPDKLASQTKGDQESFLLCNSVFITLNQRWEIFKQEENV